MKLREYRTELFSETRVPTEETAFRLLQRDPIAANVNYFAAPWAVLINQKFNWSQVNIKLDGGFTVCQHIHFQQIIPVCIRIGLDTLFTPHVALGHKSSVPRLLRWSSWVPGVHAALQPRVSALRGFQVLPFPHFAVNGAAPGKKNLWYSFIGCDTHWTRQAIFQLPPRQDCLVKQRGNWHFYSPDDRQDADKQEYEKVLARSRFSLCPRGTGPSTIRFWESLQAGAIPVLISDDMRLPRGYDWHSCVVRIPEKQVARIPEILCAIPHADEQRMRQFCLAAYEQFSGDHFVRCIREHYDAADRAAA